MAAGRPQDKYSNLASATVTQTAADTETFAEMLTGISLGQGRGMLIDQVDYFFPQAVVELLSATGDNLRFGWTTSNATAALGALARTTIHMMQLMKGPIIGTPASGSELLVLPLSDKFDPPLIVAAPRLFVAVASTSLGAVASITSRIYFRYVELTDREYLELAESFVLVG